MFRYLPLIVKNGLRNKRRSLLTIASVAISLCLLGLLGAIYHAFYFSVATPEQALRLRNPQQDFRWLPSCRSLTSRRFRAYLECAK